MANSNLHAAKRAKNDEFYTQLSDVEKEMKHYKPFFKGKKVLCNCNDDLQSAFFRYFSMNFEHLGLAKLTCVAYCDGWHGTKYVFEGDTNGNRMVDDEEINISQLEGDGSFSSPESIELLKEADVVVTNPPFSQFRDFMALMFQYEKKFLVIGNTNAVTYKEIFPHIKENKLWLGCSSFNCGMYFIVSGDYEYADTYKFEREINGHKVMRVSSICWFTNLEHNKRNLPLDLYKKYTPEEYPKYDNYDAIEVSKVCDIPADYDGVMGVPITFLDKYCPSQFQIVGIMTGSKGTCFFNGNDGKLKFSVDGKSVYERILIRTLK